MYRSQFIILFFLVSYYSFCQINNPSPTHDKTLFQKDGISNEGVQIPLYEIKLDGISIPIYLSYDNTGIKVRDVTSSVGVNWRLNAGGKITREVNHLPDEYIGKPNPPIADHPPHLPPDYEPEIDTIYGWFHNKLIMENVTGDYHDQNINPALKAAQGFKLSEHHDGSPDFYKFSVSNGDYTSFTYNKTYTYPSLDNSSFSLQAVQVESNKNYLIENEYTDGFLSLCKKCYSFKITSEEGIEYYLKKGPSNLPPIYHNDLIDIGGAPSAFDYYEHNDFYISKISSRKNNGQISFEYIQNNIVNHDIIASHFEQDGLYWEGLLITENYQNEVSEINTPKEKIIFNYNDYTYQINSGEMVEIGSGTSDPINLNLNIKLLDEILIYDIEDNFVLGYKFTYWGDTNEKLFLSKIEKIGSDQSSLENYRELGYYNPALIAQVPRPNQDVFGYSNGAISNINFNEYGDRNITPVTYQTYHGYAGTYLVNGSDRLPSLEHLKSGMLKSIKTKLGGKVEFDYIMNSDGDFYFGGVLVNTIKTYNEYDSLISEQEYAYENGIGFGIPVFGTGNWKNTFRHSNSFINDFMFTNIYNELIYKDGIDGYHKYGNYFNKVIEKRVNTSPIVDGLDNSNGSIIKYYSEKSHLFNLSKKIDKIEYLDNLDRVIKKEEYSYSSLLKAQINNIKFSNNHEWYSQCQTDKYVDHPLLGVACIQGHNYRLQQNTIFIRDYFLDTKQTTYNNPDEGTTMVQKTVYEYLNEGTPDVDFKKPKKIIKLKQNGTEIDEFNEFLYLSEVNTQSNDFSGLLHYSNPILQKSSWKFKTGGDHLLKNASIFEYYEDGKINSVRYATKYSNGDFYTYNSYQHPYYHINGNLITQGEIALEFIYDSNNKLTSQIFHNKPFNEYYLRSEDYNQNYVTAVLKMPNDVPINTGLNPGDQLFAHYSFEAKTDPNTLATSKAFSGDRVFTGSYLDLGYFVEDVNVSYWGFTNGEWEYMSFLQPSGNINLFIPSFYDFIDEVRVVPVLGSIKTTTIKPLIGVLSETDNFGTTNKAHFDTFYRVRFVTDRGGNVIKEKTTNSIND